MKHFLIVPLFLLLTACASVDSLRPGNGGSTFEVRGKAYDDIWKAAVRAMSTNLAIVESDKVAGVIKSEVRAGVATWGEVVGLYIRQGPANAYYTVEVQSLKRMRTQLTGQDWEPTVVARIKSELDM